MEVPFHTLLIEFLLLFFSTDAALTDSSFSWRWILCILENVNAWIILSMQAAEFRVFAMLGQYLNTAF